MLGLPWIPDWHANVHDDLELLKRLLSAAEDRSWGCRFSSHPSTYSVMFLPETVPGGTIRLVGKTHMYPKDSFRWRRGAEGGRIHMLHGPDSNQALYMQELKSAHNSHVNVLHQTEDVNQNQPVHSVTWDFSLSYYHWQCDVVGYCFVFPVVN